VLTTTPLALALSGCEVIGDIFQAGVWVGVILVVGVLALVGYIVAKMMG
jgi:hypothetical protein